MIKFLAVHLLMICTPLFFCQNRQDSKDISIDIQEQSYSQESRIIDLVVSVNNSSSEDFSGKLKIFVPKGFKNVIAEDINLYLRKSEKKFISVKVLVSENAAAGKNRIRLTLSDEQNKIIEEKEMYQVVDENNLLQMAAEALQIFRKTGQDSLQLKVKVSNRGNREQSVTLVFKIPDHTDQNIFIEQKGTISAQKDTVFALRFLSSREMMNKNSFVISVTGFREPNKEIFGTAGIPVQNISDTQVFQDESGTGFENTSKNSITSSYRKIGRDLDIYQVLGAGGFNVPSGYLFLSGNFYMMNSQAAPIVNNTYVSYRSEKSEFTVGNISRLLELSLFGRGVEYSLINAAQNKKIEVGFVEQSFSLIDKNPFLKNGFGFYVRGLINPFNYTRNATAVYIFKNDPFEKATHHLAGTEITRRISNYWQTTSKLYGGYSIYESNQVSKPSLAVESQYSGIIRKLNLNGNFFYSSDYYPGNRRGSIQIQQNAHMLLFKQHHAYTNVLYSNFSPKYHSFNSKISSDNIRFESGINLARTRALTYSFAYQYQLEKSNSYNSFFYPVSTEERSIKAHRLVENTTWISENRKHSANMSVEAGIAQYPESDNNHFQSKLAATYNYRKLNFTSQYQYGGYYLSEYAFSRISGKEKYHKLSVSLFYAATAFKEKLHISSGIAFTDDNIYGKAPSAFSNMKWNTRFYEFFVNSSWYNYNSSGLQNTIFSVEAGVTVNIHNNALSTRKKSNLHAVAFYDLNNNNIFDLGEEAAVDYLITINNISFTTDPAGKITYKNVPFGKYKLKQSVQQGWYYDERILDINKYSTTAEIPLHQNGTVTGGIQYQSDSRTALEFTPKTGGVLFAIYRNNILIETVSTNDSAEFISFLPVGSYTVKIRQESLPSHTYCENPMISFSVSAGEINALPKFLIRIKEKKIHSKKFTN